ncbi:MAG: hypothetical protein DDT19_00097 [Syntrophomonadaceae bacterium]|nr:hypothetical protein [Bacillota bacterium]
MESQILDFLSKGGAVGVLAVIVFLFIFGWIVSKQTYDKAAETFKESLNRIIDADKEARQADRENQKEILLLLKSLNGRFRKEE